MKGKNKQQGFTIIELVVVILLLGILTATALPRFLNVSDQAHGAVVNGVATGLQTSSALAHASWIARGQPATLNDYAGVYVNSNGFVVGDSSTGAISSNADCTKIFDTFLQVGRPVVAAAAATGALSAADVSGVDAATDFVAKAGAGKCTYVYTGQYKSVDANAVIPALVYDPADGAVSVTADAL